MMSRVDDSHDLMRYIAAELTETAFDLSCSRMIRYDTIVEFNVDSKDK